MRRMSAEQLWDSMVGLTVDAVDQRANIATGRLAYSGRVNMYDYYEEMKSKTVEELYNSMIDTYREQGMMDMNGNVSQEAVKKMMKGKSQKASKKDKQKMKDIVARLGNKIKEAKKSRNPQLVRELMIKRAELISKARSKMENSNYRRASEMRSPAPPKHLLREFGQSDRETIENANTDPAVTQVLRLMNGFVDDAIGRDENSVLTRNVLYAKNKSEAIETVFLTMLSRMPNSNERRTWQADFERDSRIAYTDLVWTLINSNEFIFVR